MRTRIKVCCISSEEEAATAIKAGADALGLVGHMPSGPGVISDTAIASIAASVPPPVASFLLTSETDAEAIILYHQKVKTSTIQIVDALATGSYFQIRDSLPGIKLVQVIHMVDATSVQEATRIAPYIDAILLDSGNPALKVKELGGTGRIHDWSLSRKIRESVSVPVFLAGGLNPQNVLDAIRAVRPFGVDLCSGVRTGGILDQDKLTQFVAAVQKA
jgi:phosphoribosylanthranilate isomerase